jgi:peptide-methionine (S)-S-oxide reductase/peptide methionine sulfoxide reductase msrA/msrB
MNRNFQRAYFAGGCFWGVEYHLARVDGVKAATSGFMGGSVEAPTYEQVCTGETGHLEVVAVEFDPAVVPFEKLAKLFFEIHDFSQTTGQGPDIGPQYLSAIFVTSPDQRQEAETLVGELQRRGYVVATTIRPATHFFPAEERHQRYYERKKGSPYCHAHRKIF